MNVKIRKLLHMLSIHIACFSLSWLLRIPRCTGKDTLSCELRNGSAYRSQDMFALVDWEASPSASAEQLQGEAARAHCGRGLLIRGYFLWVLTPKVGK